MSDNSIQYIRGKDFSYWDIPLVSRQFLPHLKQDVCIITDCGIWFYFN